MWRLKIRFFAIGSCDLWVWVRRLADFMGSAIVRGYEGFDFMRAAEWAREG